MSITSMGEFYSLATDLGAATALYGVTITPEGQEFDTPITIIFSWNDRTDDGIVDGTSVQEEDLQIFKNGSPITDLCGIDPGCNTSMNTFSVQVSSLSDFELLVLNGSTSVAEISAPIEPVPKNTEIGVSSSFTDPGFLDTHTAEWDWGDESVTTGIVTEENGIGSVTGWHTYTEPGIFTISLVISDDKGGLGAATFKYVVIYDTDAGFVTGGGWIDSPEGAYIPDPSLAGKVNFGFVSRYKKGTTQPTGNTEFQFHAGNMNFNSSSYEWLVVTGNDYARFKGSGSINGTGYYKFMVWAGDGEPDTFRIRIWEEDEFTAIETDVYDNGFDQPIDGGSILVHK